MKTWTKTIFLLVILHISGLAIRSEAQENSVLNTGNWIKISVVEAGVYRLNASDLSALGFDVATLDPRNLRIYGNGGKVLDQVLDLNNLNSLRELNIHVEGEDDSSFDVNDYLLFYAEGPHTFEVDSDAETFTLQTNYYSDTSYYYFTLSDEPGARITTRANLPSGNPKITSYDHGEYLERELYNKIQSGREWLGDRFSAATLSRNYQWQLSNIEVGSMVKIQPTVMAYSFDPTEFEISLNGFTTGMIPVEEVDDYLYDDKGIIKSELYSVSEGFIDDGNVEISLSFEPAESSRISEGYLDKLIVHVKRDLIYEGESILFQSLESTQNAVSDFEIESNQDLVLWDVTDINQAVAQESEFQANTISFSATSTQPNKYILFDPENVETPPAFEEVENQNIGGASVPDLIVVTHPEFLMAAEELASYRGSNDNLDVLVVQTHEVFNEFGSGIQDPTAIRNLAAYFYHHSSAPGKLSSLLLMGRGSYDAKNILQKGRDYVPIYESRESLDPLKTYGSDDYYGFLEDGEGEWIENGSGNHTLDIGVGRLPVKTALEANDVVQKLIQYSSSPNRFGNWRNKVLFVADDGDFNIHQDQSNQLSYMVDTSHNRFDPVKLFLDNFDQEPKAGGEKSNEMKEAIRRGVEEGALIVNFTGHGGEAGWAQESILDQFDVMEWQNMDKLALFVTATCEFGRHDNPDRISSGELTVLNPSGGAIGLVSTSRPVFSSTNFQLNKAFYRKVFEESQEGGKTIGEIFRQTKNESVSGVSNRNFSLLGDPSMKLNFPRYQLNLTAINETGLEEADTLKALSRVILEGEVQDGSETLVTAFDGEIEVTLFDKQGSITTLGDENPPYTYADWNTRLFRGKATVSGGVFSIEFVIPQNILYTLGEGKISMYAFDESRSIDAVGTNLDLVIGGVEENTENDNTPPDIDLFLNDESFLDGGLAASDSKLLVKLFDENGINISGVGVGQRLEARLDGGDPVLLNDYYSADLDDFRYGTAEFDYFDLEKGIHTIEVIAWDTYNNSSTSEISFVVEEGSFVSKTLGFPNPFRDQTSISVEHNKAGHDLEANLQIINTQGKTIVSEQYRYMDAPSRLELKNWQGNDSGNQKIEAGIYIAVVSVRSLTDGTKNKSYFKLINMN